MSNFRAWLQALREQTAELRSCLPVVERTLASVEQVARLDELGVRVRKRTASVVPDSRCFLGLRGCRVWAVVGPGGIPDDVQVVGEWLSLENLEACQPDLSGFQKEGKVVLPAALFLELLEWVKGGILADRVSLPYQLSQPVLRAIERTRELPQGGDKASQ